MGFLFPNPLLYCKSWFHDVIFIFFYISGDIGGALGLFVGASMLTVVEVIDLFLKQMNCCKHKPEKKKTIYKVKLVRKKILSQRSTTISTVN